MHGPTRYGRSGVTYRRRGVNVLKYSSVVPEVRRSTETEPYGRLGLEQTS